jgi:hypothetical protein
VFPVITVNASNDGWQSSSRLNPFYDGANQSLGGNMGYTIDLGAGQQLYVENRNGQTLLTLTSSHAGQQQSQSSGLATGEWSAPPTLFRTTIGLILRIESVQQIFVAIQAGQMQVLRSAPNLLDAQVLPLQPVSPNPNLMQPMQPMSPMSPLPPMQMGTMQMRMEPMEMRMGDMHLRMGEPIAPTTAKLFCSQCGAAVKIDDRFCSRCGSQLSPA